MADFSSFYQKSLYFTICMFIFILVFNFVIALDIFGTVTAGPITGMKPDEYAINLLGSPLSFTDIWKIGAGSLIIGAVAIAIATGSMIAVGIYLYGATFWIGFLTMWGIFTSVAMGNAMILSFLGIGFAIMIIIFISAVIGMLGGGG